MRQPQPPLSRQLRHHIGRDFQKTQEDTRDWHLRIVYTMTLAVENPCPAPSLWRVNSRLEALWRRAGRLRGLAYAGRGSLRRQAWRRSLQARMMKFYSRARPPCQVCGEYMRREGAQGQDTRWAGEVAARPWRPLQWPMGWGAGPGEKGKLHYPPASPISSRPSATIRPRSTRCPPPLDWGSSCSRGYRSA
jgi:hypothetical protein